MNKAILHFLGLSAVMLLAGCNGAPVRDSNYAPVRPKDPPLAPEGDGALYHDGYSMNWWEDLRARNVGDMLTVTLSESTNASKSAKTTADKKNSNSISNPTLFGQPTGFNVNGLSRDLSFSTSSTHSFEGDGSSTQKNALTGDITVTVTDVLPNGYLMIRGEKRIGINQGNEYIKLSGIVRPYDISAGNRVLSTKIADPTIVYVGDGMVSDSNVMGWLARFFISAIMAF